MEKISNRQLIYMGSAIVLNSTLISVPSQITAVAKADFWMSYLIAALLVLIPLWMLSSISKHFPQMDMFEIMVQRHPYAGRMIALLYTSFFFFILARDLRSAVDFVNVSLLPMTPLTVIAAFIAITLIFLSRGGLEIIARMNMLWQPLLIIVILLIPMALIREFEIRHIQPFFEYGFVPSLQGGWYAISYIGELVVLPFIFADRTFRFTSGLYSLVLGFVLLEILNWTVVLTLGVHIPSRVLYPNYEMVRQIRITDFLDRFDLPLVGVWLPAMIIKASFNLFAVCHGISRVFPNVSAKEISTPFGILALACSFWLFRNAMYLFNFNGVWPAIALIFEWIIPVFLFVLFLRPRKNSVPLLND